MNDLLSTSCLYASKVRECECVFRNAELPFVFCFFKKKGTCVCVSVCPYVRARACVSVCPVWFGGGWMSILKTFFLNIEVLLNALFRRTLNLTKLFL